MAGMHALMAYGFYTYWVGVREQRYVAPRTAAPSSISPARTGNFDWELTAKNWVSFATILYLY